VAMATQTMITDIVDEIGVRIHRNETILPIEWLSVIQVMLEIRKKKEKKVSSNRAILRAEFIYSSWFDF
jgi:hypothetical protein